MSQYSKTRWAFAWATLAVASAGIGALATSGYRYFSEYARDQAKPLVSLLSPADQSKLNDLYHTQGNSCHASILQSVGKARPTRAETAEENNPINLKGCYDTAMALATDYAQPGKDYKFHTLRFSMNNASGDTFKADCQFQFPSETAQTLATKCTVTGPTTRYLIASP